MPLTDTTNVLFEIAAGFVHQTSKHIFLTGRAGTGKTTFLKYIKENTFKKIAVVAPTGVAAINAGGVTMHSFFQLPRGLYLPTKNHIAIDVNTEVTNEHTLLKNIRFNKNKRDLLKELELLVIDEVSMVRADMLDAIDTILRHFRRQPLLPFGGVQLLYIGDLFQLPPVVNNAEWKLLNSFYKSPFFFNALVLEQAPPVYIELKQIYRQSDTGFINILNNIRNNTATKEDLLQLHQHYQPGFQPDKKENYITITSHNARADAINQGELKKLPGKIHSFEGTIKNDFNEKAFPAEKTLLLKEGAQIMFIKNDKGEVRRYYNGKIGTVKRIDKEKIFVSFPGEKEELELEKETWKNIRYNYDREKDKIEEEELGSYTQYPIRLAWAITIHKSQGLTFDKAIIDAGDSFAAGQVYVALSRLTSMQGMVLYSKINASAISTDERVIAFTKNEQAADALQQQLQQEQQTFITHSLIETFNWSKLAEMLQDFYNDYEHRLIPDIEEAANWAKTLVDKAKEQQAVSLKFIGQLQNLLATAKQDQYMQLHQRTQAAAAYFTKAIDSELIHSVQQHSKDFEGKSKVKKYIKDLQALTAIITRKKLQIEHAAQVTSGLKEGMDAVALLRVVEDQRKLTAANVIENEPEKPHHTKPPKGQTRLITLQQFKEGKSMEQIALERSLAPSTIESHLTSFIETGEIKITDLIPQEKVAAILEVIEQVGTVALGPIKGRLSDDFSFGEIRAVLYHRQHILQLPVSREKV